MFSQWWVPYRPFPSPPLTDLTDRHDILLLLLLFVAACMPERLRDSLLYPLSQAEKGRQGDRHAASLHASPQQHATSMA